MIDTVDFSALSGPSPCDRCIHASACKDLLLACSRFAFFVETGLILKDLIRHPTSAMYRGVFLDHMTNAELRALPSRQEFYTPNLLPGVSGQDANDYREIA